MPTPAETLLKALHLLAATAWIGGMFFAHFCLRPAAAATLDPPKRLPLLAAAFARFFRYVTVAVIVLLGTGFAMLLPVGFGRAPLGWHLMLATGVVMALVFGHIRVVLYPRLRSHCDAGAWPLAAPVLDRIRRLVAFNLALGVATIVVAVMVR